MPYNVSLLLPISLILLVLMFYNTKTLLTDTNGIVTTAVSLPQDSPLVSSEVSEAKPSIKLSIPQGASVLGNHAYEPDTVTVKAGDTITVYNEDTVPHTVTNGEPNQPTIRAFT